MTTKYPFRFVRNKSWERYKSIIRQFIDVDAGRQTITWAKRIMQPMTHGEDYNPVYQNIQIEALCYYNSFRNWPINKETVTGELDDENLSIMVTDSFLQSIGHLNSEGYWDFNWSEDRFIINGIIYKPSGDTQVAQAKDRALVFLLILKRDKDVLSLNFI